MSISNALYLLKGEWKMNEYNNLHLGFPYLFSSLFFSLAHLLYSFYILRRMKTKIIMNNYRKYNFSAFIIDH